VYVSQDCTAEGAKNARRLFGDERYDRTRTNAEPGYLRELLSVADQSVFGHIYSRPALPLRERSLCTIAALTALSQYPQLKAHVGGALNVGVSAREIAEVIIQMAAYAGFPTSLNAMAVAEECFREVGLTYA
jgi:alkylhydroperoxidase/carboxymuconolactone decarboxylase family protein YurZ